MAVARAYQIPRSTVLGRPARARTVYFYDEETGRLSHSETVWEPTWDDDDVDWALADMANRAEACHTCGEPTSETTRPEAEGRYVAAAVRCHACTPLEKERAKWAQAPPGMLFSVQRRE
ncbi:hypothetical protein [Sphaerimonospora thailandensis]|uniref:Uncharacterized protein n=1 Tax=Sphaerimonospora thailandensis TaxID=795644 RepID=A0A8J3RAI4_9ACTN|nr:hypothetical protein [Sphaerimonospora thailandensis]GIH70347.1 hypothetical protein Mth01_26000 [Sphaerimonospora thailandensis]